MSIDLMSASDSDKIIAFPFSRVTGVNPTPSVSASPKWELIGPVCGWGGTVLALIAVTTPAGEHLYAGTTAGCFLSTDHGATWEARNFGLTSPYIQTLVASPQFARDHTLFAGTLGSGVMRSTNGGMTWQPIDFWQGPTAVTAITLSTEGSGETIVLAGTATGGIFRSSNGGRTFSSSNFGLGDLGVLAIATSPSFETDDIAFALTSTGLHRSTNGGRAWRVVDRGLETEAVQAISLSPAFGEDGIALLATEDAGIFRSTDRGVSWKAASDGLTNQSINAIWISPSFASDKTVYAGSAGDGLFRSTDAGRTWAAVDGGALNNQAIMAICTDQSAKSVVVGLHQSGIFRSTDSGNAWEPSSTGLIARSMSGVLISPAFGDDHTLFASGIEDGIVKSTDEGETWEPANNGLPGTQILSLAISPDYASDGTILAVLAEGMFRSDDRGASWETSGPEGLEDPRMVAYSRNIVGGVAVILGSARAMYVSKDGGDTWSDVASPADDDEIVAVSISPNFLQDNTLLVSTYSTTGATRRDRDRAPGARQQFRADTPQSTITVWRSTDGGARWNPVIDQITSARWVTTAFPHDYRGDRETVRNGFFVGVGTLVQRPMWGGRQLWIAERVGKPNSGVLSLTVSSGTVWNRSVYASTTDGIYRSDDEGLTWHGMSEGLHTPTVVSIALAPSFDDDGDAFALTLGGALHRLSHADD